MKVTCSIRPALCLFERLKLVRRRSDHDDRRLLKPGSRDQRLGSDAATLLALVPHMGSASIDPMLAAVLIVVGAGGAFLGARPTSLSGQRLKQLFGLLIVVVSELRFSRWSSEGRGERHGLASCDPFFDRTRRRNTASRPMRRSVTRACRSCRRDRCALRPFPMLGCTRCW